MTNPKILEIAGAIHGIAQSPTFCDTDEEKIQEWLLNVLDGPEDLASIIIAITRTAFHSSSGMDWSHAVRLKNAWKTKMEQDPQWLPNAPFRGREGSVFEHIQKLYYDHSWTIEERGLIENLGPQVIRYTFFPEEILPLDWNWSAKPEKGVSILDGILKMARTYPKMGAALFKKMRDDEWWVMYGESHQEEHLFAEETVVPFLVVEALDRWPEPLINYATREFFQHLQLLPNPSSYYGQIHTRIVDRIIHGLTRESNAMSYFLNQMTDSTLRTFSSTLPLSFDIKNIQQKPVPLQVSYWLLAVYLTCLNKGEDLMGKGASTQDIHYLWASSIVTGNDVSAHSRGDVLERAVRELLKECQGAKFKTEYPPFDFFESLRKEPGMFPSIIQLINHGLGSQLESVGEQPLLGIRRRI